MIDPLLVTEKYGTDAIRMALLQGAAPGADIVINDQRMESARAFANKIWNAARFVFMKMESSGVQPSVAPTVQPRGTALEDRWMFDLLNMYSELIGEALSKYRYHEAAGLAWRLFRDSFCDWYLELKKPRLIDNSGENDDWHNIKTIFDSLLRLLHPMMPFLTEEIWQRLNERTPDRPNSIALARYPIAADFARDGNATVDMELVQEAVTSARGLRADLKLDPKAQISGQLSASLPRAFEVAVAHHEVIARFTLVDFVASKDGPVANGVARVSPSYVWTLTVPPTQLAALKARLTKEIEQLQKTIGSQQRQLGDETFVGKAPEHIVAGMRDKLAEYESQLAKSTEALAGL